MPSTFTENTGIELIADGEQTGAWGQTTNDNFDIVDRALNGSVSIALSGTTGTVTTGQGSTTGPNTFGQFAVLVFTGSPSGTNTVTIAPNTAQKTYFVTNSTAQTVVLSQGSGANVSVPAGLSKIVFTNGAGATAAVFDITNTLSGTFTGNLTGNVTGNASTATALQIARTIGGVSFNGTADINLPGVNQAGNQNTTGNAATATLAASATALETARTINGVSFNGTANITLPTVNTSGDQTIAGIKTFSSAVVLSTAGTATTQAVRADRNIATGTGILGGGNLTANRTLSIDIASQAEAEAGTDNTKVMTPLRVKQSVDALGAKVPLAPRAVRIITASTTFAPDLSGPMQVFVMGAGGRAGARAGTQRMQATGGGAGGLAVKLIPDALTSQSFTVTIGAAATTASISSGGSEGVAGGASSFVGHGVDVVANGGGGGGSGTGTTTVPGGTGGTATGGDLNRTGGTGGPVRASGAGSKGASGGGAVNPVSPGHSANGETIDTGSNGVFESIGPDVLIAQAASASVTGFPPYGVFSFVAGNGAAVTGGDVNVSRTGGFGGKGAGGGGACAFSFENNFATPGRGGDGLVFVVYYEQQ